MEPPDRLFHAKEGLPGRAPLDLNQIFWLLTSPGNRNARQTVVILHRSSNKYLLFCPVLNAPSLQKRLIDRINLGTCAKGTTLCNAPVFCPKCYCRLEDFGELSAHLIDDRTLPCRSVECYALQITMRRIMLSLLQIKSHDEQLQVINDRCHYIYPLTPETVADKLGDFEDWLAHGLQPPHHLLHCSLCRAVQYTENDRVEHFLSTHCSGPRRLPPPTLMKITGLSLPSLCIHPLPANQHQSYITLFNWAKLSWELLILFSTQNLGIHTFWSTIKKTKVAISFPPLVLRLLGDNLGFLWEYIGRMHLVDADLWLAHGSN